MSVYVLSGAAIGGAAGAALSSRAKRVRGGVLGALVGTAVGGVLATAATVLETGEVPVATGPWTGMLNSAGTGPCPGPAAAAAGMCKRAS